jgi:hypothetical protein
MISKIEKATLLCVSEKKWEIKEKNTSGISHNALVYADKAVTVCKIDETLYNQYKDKEMIKGSAIIDVQTTNYNEKEKVVYRLISFTTDQR